MRIVSIVGNRSLILIVLFLSLNIAAGIAAAYASGGPPATMGHSVEELDLAPLFIDDVNGRIGIGISGPSQSIDVSGAIQIGDTLISEEGVIRWNGTDFVGYDGSAWKSFTALGGSTIGGTGTANYIAKWGGADTLSNSMIYESGGIGIGTTDINIMGAPAGYNTLTIGTGTDQRNGRIELFGKNRIAPAGALGSISFFHQAGGSYEYVGEIEMERDDADDAAWMRFWTRQAGEAAPKERMRIASTGNVGIGTASPDARLVTKENGTLGTDTAANKANSGLRITNSDDTQSLNFDSNQIESLGTSLYMNHGSANDVYMASGGGDVGIGTSAPTERLDVEGNLQMNDNLIKDASLLSGNAFGFQGWNILGAVHDKLIRADQKYTVTSNPDPTGGTAYLAYMFDGTSNTRASWVDADLPVTIDIELGTPTHYWYGFAIEFTYNRRVSGVKIEKLADPVSPYNCLEASWSTVYENLTNDQSTILVRNNLGNGICQFRVTLSGTPEYADDIRLGEIGGWQYYYGQEGAFVRVTGDTMYGDLNIKDKFGGAYLFIDGSGTGDEGLGFKEDGDDKWLIYRDDSRDGGLRIYSYESATTPFFATTGGNVGIGTYTPNFNLHVDGTFMTDTDTGSQKSYISRIGSTSQAMAMWVDDVRAYFAHEQDEDSGSGGGFTFQMDDDGTQTPYFSVNLKSGAELFRIQDTGNVVASGSVCANAGADCVGSSDIVYYGSSCSGNFNVPSATNYLIIAKGDKYFGDANIYNYLRIDGVRVDTVYIGDYVGSGGEGGGRNQATFMDYISLSSGSHSFQLETASGSAFGNCDITVIK